MKKTLALAGIGAMALMGLATPAHADHEAGHQTGTQMISYCHGTSSDQNPYVALTTSVNALTQAGHGNNDAEHETDIIPPIPGVLPDGKNWTAAGQAILANGCKPVPVPTETATTPPPKEEHKVTLCHRTGSATNPYVIITVDYHAIVEEGHDGHDQTGNGPVGDIIPPFAFDDVVYEGKNWTAEGQAIFAAGCVIVAPTTPVPTITETVIVPGPEVTVPGKVVVKPGPGVVVKTAPPAGGAARGFNSQTAAGESPVMGNTAIAAGVALLATAAGLVFYRRQSTRSH